MIQWRLSRGRLFRTACFFGLCLGHVLAVSAEPNKISAPFDQFKLTDVSGARYVMLTAAGGRLAETRLPFNFPPYAPYGNAWMLDEIRNPVGHPVKGTFVINGDNTVEIHWSKRPIPMPSEPNASPKVYGTWIPTQCQADARVALRFLADQRTKQSPSLADPARGRLMVFSMHLSQRGEQDYATKIQEALFVQRGGRDQILEATGNCLAQAQYQTLYGQFLRDYNWSTYAEGIRGLLNQYPGWIGTHAAHTLLDHVGNRMAGQMPLPDSVMALPESDQKLAADLLNIRTVRIRTSDQAQPLWLIPSSWSSPIPEKGDVNLTIRARGMSGLPLLLALFEDTALTEIDSRALKTTSYLFRTDRFRDSFAEMDRPATRGEAAKSILLTMLPARLLQTQPQQSDTELFEATQAFYEQYSQASEEELAIQFLPTRHSSSAVAETFLLKAAEQKRLPALEAFLLGQGDNIRSSDRHSMASRKARLFMQYAAIRGSEVESLASELARQLDPVNAQAAAWVKSGYLRMTLEDLLLDYRDRPRGSNSYVCWMVLSTKTRILPPSNVLKAILEKTLEVNQIDRRTRMATALGAMPVPASDKAGLLPTDWRDLWLAVILDKRPMRENGAREPDAFLCEYERLFSSHNPESLINAYPRLGRQFVQERVLARLNAVPESELAPYPENTPPLSEAQQTLLSQQLASLTSQKEADRLVESLSLYERVALPEILRTAPELNMKLLPLANTLVRVDAKAVEPALRKNLADAIGKPVTATLLNDLYAYCQALEKAEQPVSCLVARRQDLGGYEITMHVTSNNKEFTETDSQYIVCAPDLYSALTQNSDEEAQETFVEALADACSAKVIATDQVVIKFQRK
jgi:hypothetical protein